MDSPVTPSDAQVKTPNLGAGLLSSFGTAAGRDAALDKMFSDMLSENKQADQTPQQQPQPPTSASSSSSSTQQNSQTGSADNADNAGDTSDANDAQSGASASSTQTSAGSWHLAWKLWRHEQAADQNSQNGTGKDKNKSNTASTDDSGANNAATAAATTPATPPPPPVTAANQPLATDPNAATDNTDNACAGANSADAAPTPTTNTDNPATATANNPDPTNAGTGTAANAGTADATNGQNAANGTDGTNTGNGSYSAQLSMLLMQLSRMAGRGNQQVANGDTDPTANSSTTQTTNTKTSTITDPQDKADLKALLAELANRSANGDPATGDTTGNAADAQSAGQLSATDPSANGLQGAKASQSGNTSSDTGKTAWMNSDFFNMFNATPPNPSSANPAVMPVTAANLAALASDTGNSSSDTDADVGGDDRGASTSRNLVANTDADTTPLVAGQTQASNPYDFASQLSALREAKGGSTGLPTPVEQVVLQLARTVKDGSSQMSLQLKPADLGRIDVKLNISSDGKVQGTVTADNPATLDLLLKDVRSLERALQEAGLRADPGSLQFGMMTGGQSGNSFAQTSGGNNGQSYAPASSSATADTTDTSLISADNTETYYVTLGRVNLRV
jgi:hypothetical protein